MATPEQEIESWLHHYAPPDQPLDGVRETLLALYREEVPDLEQARLARHVEELSAQEIAEEIVVAYGVGWRRYPQGEDGCVELWPTAFERLLQYVYGWMVAADKWLRFVIQLHGYGLTARFPSMDDAELIALELYRGKCRCWRLRHPHAPGPSDRYAQQRATRCQSEHHLTAWNPQAASFWNFIARAVKGDKPTGFPRFAPAAFEQGMFFCYLHQAHDVRYGKVHGWRCPHHPKVFREGPRCFECDTQKHTMEFDETLHRRDAKRLLLVAAPTGHYAEEEYWRCQEAECKNYYVLTHDRCPIATCRHPRGRGAARSTVWVRGSPFILERPPGGQEPERNAAIIQAIAQLPPDWREIVEMTFWDGMSSKEIASKLHHPQREIKAALREALKQLRSLLGNDFDNTES